MIPRALRSLLLAAALSAGPISAQATYRTEEVLYRNPRDSVFLTGTLYLPTSGGPFPGVVLMSIAGADPMVEHLTGLGYVVLIPVRRGFVAVEPLLQSSYEDLSTDGLAALDYLRARPDVVDDRLALIGQGDDAGPAMLAAALDSIPLVLLGPPAFPGPEVFRLEQRAIARSQSWRPQQLEALDQYIAQIVKIVLEERSPYFKEYQLEELIFGSPIQLPYNAAFPSGRDQPHFFASPLWRDRLQLEPERVLARLTGPVLVLFGEEDADPDAPIEEFLGAVQRGLDRAPSADKAVCLLQGRTRHFFGGETVRLTGAWLGGTLGLPSDRAEATTRLNCA